MKITGILTALVVSAAMTITASAYDLTTVTDITAEELAPYMHPDTRHLASDVIEICTENGVSIEFIATVIRWERNMENHNLFGWRDNDGKYMVFASDRECLETIIPRIKSMYLTDGGCYYNGATVDGVSLCYNNSDFWREKMSEGINWILEG